MPAALIKPQPGEGHGDFQHTATEEFWNLFPGMGGKDWKCCGEGVGAPHVLGKHRSSALGISLQIKDERNTGCGAKQNIWE